MGIKPVLLLTDLLVFTLIVCAAFFAIQARKHAPSREAWRRVGRQPAAMASAVILSVFAVIGVMDSLHYRPQLPLEQGESADAQEVAPVVYSSEVLSVLDALLMPLRVQMEKTYSAPFARESFQRETVELADGGQARINPRLVYGASHLQEGEPSLPDIVRRLIWAPLQALAVAGALLCVVGVMRRQGTGIPTAMRQILAGRTELAWRPALVVVFLRCCCLRQAWRWPRTIMCSARTRLGRMCFTFP